ncbi:hypothetical protein [Pseudomonas sp. GXZC]|uniref:hypothetical protein n=1 Tax=Pseudomonas sp. GXZC TaxID=3003351 RepID=UPI0022AA8E67|nr:hypothetical protein [Pseudomonas sp. GXZC]WAT32231.1 hypothetical protein OZ428_33685 [Pseudomonas sp. GXZC]
MRQPNPSGNACPDALDLTSLHEFDELIIIGENDQVIGLQLASEAVAIGIDPATLSGRFIYADLENNRAYPVAMREQAEFVGQLPTYEVHEISYCLAGRTHANTDLSLGSYHSPAARHRVTNALRASNQGAHQQLSSALASVFRTRQGDRVITDLTSDLTEGLHGSTASGRVRQLVVSALETLCAHLDAITPLAQRSAAANIGDADHYSQPGPGH